MPDLSSALRGPLKPRTYPMRIQNTRRKRTGTRNNSGTLRTPSSRKRRTEILGTLT